jgi:hypothetical protein
LECRGLDDGKTKQPHFVRRADHDPMVSPSSNWRHTWAVVVTFRMAHRMLLRLNPGPA